MCLEGTGLNNLGKYVNQNMTVGITPNNQLHFIPVSIVQRRHGPENCISRSSKTAFFPTFCIKFSDSEELFLDRLWTPTSNDFISNRLWPLPNCPRKWSTWTVQGLPMILVDVELCSPNLVNFAMNIFSVSQFWYSRTNISSDQQVASDIVVARWPDFRVSGSQLSQS